MQNTSVVKQVSASIVPGGCYGGRHQLRPDFSEGPASAAALTLRSLSLLILHPETCISHFLPPVLAALPLSVSVS